MTQSQNVKRRWHFSRTDEKCQIHRFQKTNKFQAEEIHKNAHLDRLHKEKETWKTNKAYQEGREEYGVVPRVWWGQHSPHGCPTAVNRRASSPLGPSPIPRQHLSPDRRQHGWFFRQTETQRLPPAESTNRCNSDKESDSRWEIYKRKNNKEQRKSRMTPIL